MEIQLEEEKQKLYSRLFVSAMDLSEAAFSLAMLMKKGWHGRPWERRGRIYEQQTAYVTALVIAYARPFNRSIGWPKYPADLMPFEPDERALHNRLILMRNQVIAHSDSAVYRIRPWCVPGFSTDIVGREYPLISAEDGAMLREMITKLQAAIKAKLEEILPHA